jgi:hypothetical protein
MVSKSVDLNEAVTMRKFGFSYQQIAQTLKCSVQWCAFNLKGIEADSVLLYAAYDMYKKVANETCEQCSMHFTLDNTSAFYNENVITDKKYCSNKCAALADINKIYK